MPPKQTSLSFCLPMPLSKTKPISKRGELFPREKDLFLKLTKRALRHQMRAAKQDVCASND